ncbi:flagellar basal body L-ring protein FlgH [Aliarcobacter cibarius]|jgi:flagellar L-ring protein FlgH|uniref:Flagellar L-ring protein n=1 Tax=Aliarcobacter cibarius TaxID=255507 RepID=A0ABY2V5N9_9BACT|nr:flagellar basal body L-ring protein FlgH [Aliarcobacter cibarius]TLT00821.1 flagellar basal body L-ring protein FlgH [Aliarcobacter cibarius]TLT01391.1 flagellar basal body L-ring protein FlgH [Aliarcobacter cibarius]
MKNSIFIILLAFIFTSCTSLSKPTLEFDKPEVQTPKKQPEARKNKGSLYSVQGTSLFADKKDLQLGDIIQIVINEDLTSKTDSKRELTSDRENKLGGGAFASMDGGQIGGIVGSATDAVNRNLGVNFNTASSTSDKGKVKTQVTEKFQTTISAIIEETYQNGNYFIKGKKEVLLDEQKQTIIISGIIRPYDITSDNSINSSQMADLKILYEKDGTEADILDTPWGTRLLRAIWPF